MTIRQSFPLEFKFAGSDAAEGVLTGFASTWGGPPDSYGDIVERGAFAKSLGERWPVMLFAHSQSRPVGKWLEVAEDARGLRVKGQINLQTTDGRETHAMLKHGDLGGLSIGFGVPEGGRIIHKDGTATLTEIELFEISVVAIPANPRATVTGVKTFGSRAELEEILRESLPARAAKKLLSGGWPALSGEEDEQDPAISELAALVKAARRELSTKGKW
jgi:HK97 family phage prohead protease